MHGMMLDFQHVILVPNFYEGSELRRIDICFDDEAGTFELRLVIHWWQEAKDEGDYPG